MTWETQDQTWHYVEKWAQETPDVEALVFGDERLTFKDFKLAMDNIALAFLDVGVSRGDRIALLSMARNEFLTTFMAANKVGATWVGLNPKFTLDELRYQIEDCKPSVLIVVRFFMGEDQSETIECLLQEFPFIKKLLVIGDACAGTGSFDEFVDRPRDDLISKLEERAATATADDTSLLMYTSGSTGRPKGVVHTHRSNIENIKVQVEKFRMHGRSRSLLHFPINHVAASIEIGFSTIMVGGCCVLMDSFHPVDSLHMIERERITLVGQVPVMFLLQMKEDQFREMDFSGVEMFIWAGSAAPKILVDVLAGICDKTGAKLLTGYGSTETCGFVTYTEVNEDADLLTDSAGRIADPFELKIVDDDRRELPDGETGEIAVRGPFMFSEYLMAYKDESGHIFINGRKSEMYKTGGENVFPREVEEVLECHDGVLFASVIGVPDELYQEVGWAFVMPQPGVEIEKGELIGLCKERLANFKVPKKILLRQSLPLLATGKVDKCALKQESGK